MGRGEVSFSASRVFVHRWPRDGPGWDGRASAMAEELNGAGEKRVTLGDRAVLISGHRFDCIRKVGVSVPMFRKEARMIFEGRSGESGVHVHVTAGGADYLEVLGCMSEWRDGLEGGGRP